MTTRTRLARLVPVAALALALVGCGSSSKASSGAASTAAASGATSTAAASAAAGGATSGNEAFAAGDAAGQVATTAAAATTAATTATGSAPPSTGVGTNGIGAPVTDGRKIIVNMALEIEVAKVSTAAAQVRAFAAGAGAQVFSEQTSLVTGSQASTMVLKVPPGQVNSLLTQLGGIGSVTAQTTTSDDVTAQFVDLEARIGSAQRSVARAREFLDKAEDVNQLAAMEGELSRRESELEQLQGQKRVLENHVDLATITVTLKPAPPPTTTTTTVAPTTTTTVKPTVGRALHNGGRTVSEFLKAIAMVLAFLLPWSPFLLLGALAVWAVRRRMHRAAAARPPAGPGTAAAGWPRGPGGAGGYGGPGGWPGNPVSPAPATPPVATPEPEGPAGEREPVGASLD